MEVIQDSSEPSSAIHRLRPQQFHPSRRAPGEAAPLPHTLPAQIQMDFGTNALGSHAHPNIGHSTPGTLQIARRMDARPHVDGPVEEALWISDRLEAWAGGLLVVLVGLVSAALTPL